MTYIPGTHFHSCDLPGTRMMHLILLLWIVRWYIPPVVFASLVCPSSTARGKWFLTSLFRWMKVFTSRKLVISHHISFWLMRAVCSDYNTRFSGVTEENHSKATAPLALIRKTLDKFINQETILVGHALDNDLKTMRIVHKRCVDTAILFPHRAGPPYRRALKDMWVCRSYLGVHFSLWNFACDRVREKLGKLIQTGDASTGHSSAEDAGASLDLVRWFILNESSKSSSPISNSLFEY